MTTNTFFNWSRFQLLLRKNILENWKTYGLRLLCMFGALAIGMLWSGYYAYRSTPYNINEDPTIEFMSIFFIWMLLIFGALSASFVMEELKTKTNKISYLMNPASQFEKFFMKWIISVVLFLIVYIVLFKFADCAKVILYRIVYPQNNSIDLFSFSHIVHIGNTDFYCLITNWTHLGMAISGFLFGQSLFILGGTIWPKNAFIKTLGAITTIIIISIFIIYHSFNAFYSGNFIDMPELMMSRAFTISCSILAVFNWVIAYFRFKETEIINRM